jgi:hypothetical protein
VKISLQRSAGAGLERRQLRIEVVPGRRASRPDVHLRTELRRVVEAVGLEDTTSDRLPSLPAIGLPHVEQKPRSIRVIRSDVTAW